MRKVRPRRRGGCEQQQLRGVDHVGDDASSWVQTSWRTASNGDGDLAIFVMLHGGDPDLDIETRLPSHTAHCCDGRRSSWKVP